MRRLTEDELRAIGDALCAGDATELDTVVGWQFGDLPCTLEFLTLGLVCGAPFARRNRAVAVSAAALVARLNGHVLDLEPEEEVTARLAALAAGDSDGLRAWFLARLAPAPAASGPRCPGCGMPLRECLTVVLVARVLTPHCGGCGRLLARPARDPRQLQEA